MGPTVDCHLFSLSQLTKHIINPSVPHSPNNKTTNTITSRDSKGTSPHMISPKTSYNPDQTQDDLIGPSHKIKSYSTSEIPQGEKTEFPIFGKSHNHDSQHNFYTNLDTMKTDFTMITHQPDYGTGIKTKPHVQSTDGDLITNSLPSVDTPSSYMWPSDILETIKIITATPSCAYKPSNFKFECTNKAASHNWKFLSSFENLGIALAVDSSSHTKYGSEFRPATILKHIFRHHPLWHKLSDILTNGISFPLSELDDTTRKMDLENALSFGNHKGVTMHPKFFKQLSYDDILSGYATPIPKCEITKLVGASICPMNVIEQFTISKSGEIVEKQRACHDLSFRMTPSNTSVNDRLVEENLFPCMFGHCLARLIHYIVALRLEFPTTPILIQKIDWKSAYRRAHMSWTTALQCCSVFKD